MLLRKATIEETQTAMTLLKETAEWLNSIGSSQWSDVLDGEDKYEIAKAVKNGEVFFFYNSNELIGMAAAWRKPTAWDERLWKDQEFNESVYYLHRVIIHPRYRGKGYGKELLNALKSEFTEAVSELRLDCLASNSKLVQFYRDNNFTHVGNGKSFDGIKFELFSYYQ
ncbi:GNAT family N-acetyltransferase [Candidatus Enterococcus mansonii]|uniref:N-acetyltransferase domain-containing protein n=1 Tax=Candidatus Enterococcus mansonii TaxID=1834181 RepID=A0A242CEU0_9ENTE|nr:GNAT family N-acetyltransferase [Enterococcus sp. 4G2_DIV0659]OTO08292.1 hypothetical protein A5880_002563 [Enterococcus sp. 4G2_DIV0659]